MTSRLELLRSLYPDHAETVAQALDQKLARFAAANPGLRRGPRTGLGLDQRHALLIAYGDQVRAPGEAPLRTLKRFMDSYLSSTFTGLHLLPHFVSSSDGGFSVVDFRTVDPELGTWEDVAALSDSYDLMFDAVINHASARSAWFEAFLAGRAPYDDYFVELDPAEDVASVTRPRPHPLSTRFASASGEKHVWTTFSTDQIDLNYRNPAVLLEVVDILLEYAARGARLLRLDAIGFLWKELGTSCMHLPQTHAAVKLIRAVFDEVMPHMLLVPEINGSYEENAQYFGNGEDEAQLVYNFTLAPLVLFAMYESNAAPLMKWLREVRFPSSQTTFFNFLASHDGIGVRAAEPLLSTAEFASLIDGATSRGAEINERTVGEGQRRPYEICTTLYDALHRDDEPLAVGIQRFRAAHVIMLSIAGVPGVYFHSLFGTPAWREGWKRDRHHRTLNRRKFELDELESALSEQDGRFAQVLSSITHLLRARRAEPAFSPTSPQTVLDLPPEIFGVERGSGDEAVRCLVNVSGQSVRAPGLVSSSRDLLSDRRVAAGSTVDLGAYDAVWLKKH